jgi:phosphohistidine phosphatase
VREVRRWRSIEFPAIRADSFILARKIATDRHLAGLRVKICGSQRPVMKNRDVAWHGGFGEMDLILWRHADAGDALPGRRDVLRALSPKGRRQARRMARWLNKHGPTGMRVLVSPAVRTCETAQALARPFETVAALGPEAQVSDLLAAADWPDAGQPVLLVGHQPTLGRLAAWLLTGVEQPWTIRKGSIWWLRSRPAEWTGGPAAPERPGRGVTLLAVRQPDAS